MKTNRKVHLMKWNDLQFTDIFQDHEYVVKSCETYDNNVRRVKKIMTIKSYIHHLQNEKMFYDILLIMKSLEASDMIMECVKTCLRELNDFCIIDTRGYIGTSIRTNMIYDLELNKIELFHHMKPSKNTKVLLFKEDISNQEWLQDYYDVVYLPSSIKKQIMQCVEFFLIKYSKCYYNTYVELSPYTYIV